MHHVSIFKDPTPLPRLWLRRTCLKLTLTALSLVQPARAGDTPSAFDAANQALAEGNPTESSRRLEAIIAKQGYSAPVLFNLANAQLRAGKPGQAILNYERARWLAPCDADIAANLRLALEHVQPASPAPGRLFLWANSFTLNTWANLAATSLLLLAATLPLALVLPARRRMFKFARITALVALLGSLATIGVRWGELNRAIVIAKQADARISPVTVGQPIFTLPQGTTVNLVRPHGRFTLIRTPDGRQGWIACDLIEPVVALPGMRL